MSFKSLNIRREKIEETIRSCDPTFEVFGPSEKSNNLFVYKIVSSGLPEALLNVYHNKDGSTTIATNIGKNQPLSEHVAQHIVEVCEIRDIIVRPLSIARLTQRDYDELITFLELNDCKIVDGSIIPSGSQKKVIGPYGDHVFLNYYKTMSFNVQGGSCVVKSIVIEGLTDYLPFKKIIESQLVVIDVNITVDEVIDEFRQIVPTAYDYLGEKLVAIMSPAIALQHVNIELSDYSLFAYPALRGLEGYIKKLLLDKGIKIEKNAFGTVLVPSNNKFKLTQSAAQTVNCVKTAQAIEDSYNFYNRHRNGLFHVDQDVSTTRTIEERRIAEEIIQDVLSIMESSYSNIKS